MWLNGRVEFAVLKFSGGFIEETPPPPDIGIEPMGGAVEFGSRNAIAGQDAVGIALGGFRIGAGVLAPHRLLKQVAIDSDEFLPLNRSGGLSVPLASCDKEADE